MGRLTGNTSSRRTIFHQHTLIHKDTSRVVATAATTNCYIHFFCTKTSALVVCLCDYVCVCVCRMGNSRRSFPWVSGADRTSSARGSYLTTSRMGKEGRAGGGRGEGGLHAATHKISTPRAEKYTHHDVHVSSITQIADDSRCWFDRRTDGWMLRQPSDVQWVVHAGNPTEALPGAVILLLHGTHVGTCICGYFVVSYEYLLIHIYSRHVYIFSSNNSYQL